MQPAAYAGCEVGCPRLGKLRQLRPRQLRGKVWEALWQACRSSCVNGRSCLESACLSGGRRRWRETLVQPLQDCN